jgi:predicted DNA-binding protein (UPF0251 family)
VLKPRGIPLPDVKVHWLALDEFEAMRLCDLEGLSQIEAGERMQISRGTVQRLLESGRRKVMQALLANQGLGLSSTSEHPVERMPLIEEKIL